MGSEPWCAIQYAVWRYAAGSRRTMTCCVRSAICQAAKPTATATVAATAHHGTGLEAPRKPGQLAGRWRSAK